MARNKSDKGGHQSKKQLSADITSAIWKEAAQFAGIAKPKITNLKDASIWENPNILSFADFAASSEHMHFPPLTPRQLMLAEYMFGEHPAEMFSNNRNTAVVLWGKGSLLSSQEIVTSNGERMTVEECADRNIPVSLWSRSPETGRVVSVVSTPAIRKPNPENCFRVRTSFGHISEASEDHRYFTVNGWRKLKEIKVGDWILGGKPTDIPDIYHEPESLARWAGYVIGGEGRADEDTLRNHARRLGIYGKTSADKRIPITIMFSGIDTRRSFLEALYATDGWISRHSRGGWEIGYIAKNRKLIEDLDFMLRSFGIVGKIRPKYATYKSGRREYWQLIICHRGEQRKFSALFRIPGKSSVQAEMDAELTAATRSQGLRCPRELTALAQPAVAQMAGHIDSSIRGRTKHSAYSYETVSAIPGMDTFANDDVVWEQVLDIQPLGMQTVYTLTVPMTENYLQGGLFHHNSGKDTLSALMILYVIYVLLNLKNPQNVLGLADTDSIDIMNVAATKEQAQDVFYEIVKNHVLSWKWLAQHFDIQVSGRYFSSVKKDVQNADRRVVITNDAIIFPKHLRAFSGSSEAESQEGKNLYMFVLDEADAFKTESRSRTAAKVYRMCRTSAFSRFKRNYKGFIISYPRSSDGFIMRMYNQSKRFLNMYGDLAMTWEVKPRSMFSKETFDVDGVPVPMDFYDEFRQDPIGSRRAYMCSAPVAETAFLDDPEKVDQASREFSHPTFEFKDSVKDGLVRKDIVTTPHMPDPTLRYELILDLGIKKDPTALTLMHRDADKVIVDFVTRWIPDPDKKIKVDLQNVEDIILKIRDTVTIKSLHADHWQSAMLVQKLRGKGMSADVMKIDFEDYEIFKRMLYSGGIVLPKNAALISEIKKLQMYSGRKVDHPEGGHNDMAVTVVMGLKVLTKISKEGQNSSNLAAEGEYVGDNLHESVEPYDEKPYGMDEGIVIDGIPWVKK